MQEKMTFIEEENILAEIIEARNRQLITELDNDGQGERVICYAKDVALFNDIIQTAYVDGLEISGFHDILRYDVRLYLCNMANPTQRKSYL